MADEVREVGGSEWSDVGELANAWKANEMERVGGKKRAYMPMDEKYPFRAVPPVPLHFKFGNILCIILASLVF